MYPNIPNGLQTTKWKRTATSISQYISVWGRDPKCFFKVDLHIVIGGLSRSYWGNPWKNDSGLRWMHHYSLLVNWFLIGPWKGQTAVIIQSIQYQSRNCPWVSLVWLGQWTEKLKTLAMSSYPLNGVVSWLYFNLKNGLTERTGVDLGYLESRSWCKEMIV